MVCSFDRQKRPSQFLEHFKKIREGWTGRKPNKLWVDKVSELYNRSMKSWLQGINIEIYSIHDEENSVISVRFIRINNFYKYMTSISKNVYIDELADTVDKNKNKYHKTIKLKPIDVRSSIYINHVSITKVAYAQAVSFLVKNSFFLNKQIFLSEDVTTFWQK